MLARNIIYQLESDKKKLTSLDTECEWFMVDFSVFQCRLGTTDSKRWRQRQAERWRCGDGNTGCLIDNSIDKYESAGLLKAEEMEKMVACD